MSFRCHFWAGTTLEPTDEAVLQRFVDVSLSTEVRLAALAELLDSESIPAQCIALDQYSYSQGQGGFARQEWLDPLEARVRSCIARQLDGPPFVRPEADARPQIGANHASALHAMWHMADDDDGLRVANALVCNRDPQVLELGVQAAEILLDGEESLDEKLAGELRRLVHDREQPTNVRAGAIAALGASASDLVVPWLLGALDNDELSVCAAAARRLLERDLGGFRSRVAPIAKAWPESDAPPYDMIEVRRLLAGMM